MSYRKLFKELKALRKKGVALYLEGQESSPKEILKAFSVAERGAYMRDYISDPESSRLTGLCFDRVRDDPAGNGK